MQPRFIELHKHDAPEELVYINPAYIAMMVRGGNPMNQYTELTMASTGQLIFVMESPEEIIKLL